MRTLSYKMLAVLKELAKPGVTAGYMRYMGRFNPIPYYSLSSTWARCTAQINGLVDRGLAERFNGNELNDDHDVRITKAGREFLRQTGAIE